MVYTFCRRAMYVLVLRSSYPASELACSCFYTARPVDYQCRLPNLELCSQCSPLSTLYAIMHVILGHCLGTRRNSFVLLVPVCLRDQKNSQPSGSSSVDR